MIELQPDLSLLVIAAIFLLNALVVRKYLVQPIIGVLEWRESEIEGSAKRYEETLARFNEATAKMEEKLHQARHEGAEIREQQRAEAADYREQMVGRVRGEAEQIVTDASQQLGTEVESARATVARESEQLARLAAERILGRKIA
jgi:F-type H+-transporting ATPase subunit b